MPENQNTPPHQIKKRAPPFHGEPSCRCANKAFLRKNLSVHQYQFLGRSKVARFQSIVHHAAGPQLFLLEDHLVVAFGAVILPATTCLVQLRWPGVLTFVQVIVPSRLNPFTK